MSLHPSEGKFQDKNEGEGSRTAAHHYADGVKRTIESGKVDALAEKARQSVEGAEGETLRKAEKIGKAGKKPSA